MHVCECRSRHRSAVCTGNLADLELQMAVSSLMQALGIRLGPSGRVASALRRSATPPTPCVCIQSLYKTFSQMLLVEEQNLYNILVEINKQVLKLLWALALLYQ